MLYFVDTALCGILTEVNKSSLYNYSFFSVLCFCILLVERADDELILGLVRQAFDTTGEF